MTKANDHRVVELTLAKVCSVNCAPMCPQMKAREAYGDGDVLLSMDNFKTALDHIPKDVDIVFAGHAEPFMNRNAVEMMEMAHSEGRRVELFSTLVGLSEEDVPRLVNAVDKFVWHLPDNKGIAHINKDERYWKTLGAILDQMDIHGYSRMDGTFKSNERAGNCDNAEPFHFKGPFYCRKLTTPQFVMLPDGRTLLCCMDWGSPVLGEDGKTELKFKHIVGNLLIQTFDEIARDKPYREISAGMHHWDDDILCRSCTVPRSIPRELMYRGYKLGQRYMGGSQGGPKATEHGIGLGGSESDRKMTLEAGY